MNILCPSLLGEVIAGRRADPVDGLIDVEIPELCGAVAAAGGQDVFAWLERDRVDCACVGDGLAHWSGVGRIGNVPQPNRVVATACGQGPSVLAERDSPDGVGGPGQGMPDQDGFGKVGDIPEADRIVTAA